MKMPMNVERRVDGFGCGRLGFYNIMKQGWLEWFDGNALGEACGHAFGSGCS